MANSRKKTIYAIGTLLGTLSNVEYKYAKSAMRSIKTIMTELNVGVDEHLILMGYANELDITVEQAKERLVHIKKILNDKK